MNDSPITDETLWRVVDILDRRQENSGKTLEELGALATRAILSLRKASQQEASNYKREEVEKHFESMERISEQEIARLVIRDKNKDRGIIRFREFAEFLMEPQNKLEPDNRGYAWFTEYLESHQWPKGWVPYFQKLLPKWLRLKKALSQRGRKKKPKKVFALTE